MFSYSLLVVLAPVVLRLSLRRKIRQEKGRHFRKRRSGIIPSTSSPSSASGFPQKKPEWVKQAVLSLHGELGLSHRKLAQAFNRLHFASTGVSVGRTWVRALLMKHAYDALHNQRQRKHQFPRPMSVNRVWGIDTTELRDTSHCRHIVLGIIDHGTRLNLALRKLQRFNTWTLLGCLFLAIGEFGKPDIIKSDNHQVIRSKWVKRVMRWSGVSMRFSEPGNPWQNGRIERLFGTFKLCLRGYAISNGAHLTQALASFRFWYNEARFHQHLGGCTPTEAWNGIDPYAFTPQTASLFSAWNGRLRGLVLRY